MLLAEVGRRQISARDADSTSHIYIKGVKYKILDTYRYNGLEKIDLDLRGPDGETRRRAFRFSEWIEVEGVD